MNQYLRHTSTHYYVSDTFPEYWVDERSKKCSLWVQAVYDLLSKNRCTILKQTLRYAMGYWLQIPEGGGEEGGRKGERGKKESIMGQDKWRELILRANFKLQTCSGAYISTEYWHLGRAFIEIMVRKIWNSFTNWLKGSSEKQVHEEFCSM